MSPIVVEPTEISVASVDNILMNCCTQESLSPSSLSPSSYRKVSSGHKILKHFWHCYSI